MNIDRTFNSGFDFKIIDSPEETELDFYCFPGAFKGGWVIGVAVEFSQFGWTGSFANGSISAQGITGVYTHPNKEKLLIVSKGQGYLVEPANPENTKELREQPILGVYTNRENNLIIVHDFIRFTAFGLDGEKWKTPAISYDGIKVDRITGESIFGSAWSAPEDKWIEFTLELKTGKYEGGAR